MKLLKRLYMMNKLKTLMLFRLLMLVIQLKKLTKIDEIENRILGHNPDKYITPQKSNNFTADNSATRLARLKLATKNNIADFVKETDFDCKLKNINEKFTSNKTKRVDVEKKLTGLTKELHNYRKKGMLSCLVECILQPMMVTRDY